MFPQNFIKSAKIKGRSACLGILFLNDQLSPVLQRMGRGGRWFKRGQLFGHLQRQIPKQGSTLLDLFPRHLQTSPPVRWPSQSLRRILQSLTNRRRVAAWDMQKNILKDATLVRLPRADARHVQEGVQAYAICPSTPRFLLIYSPLDT